MTNAKVLEIIISNNTLIGTIFGAIVGASAASLMEYHLWRKGEADKARRMLLEEMITYVQECKGALLELHSARLAEKSIDVGLATRNVIAELTRLEGKGLTCDVRLWQFFRKSKVTNGFSKLHKRILKARQLILNNPMPSQSGVDLAFRWIEDQAGRTIQFACDEAGVRTTRPEHLEFVGLRRVSDEDRRDFSTEDEPPPWEFHFSLDFADRDEHTRWKEIVARKLQETVGSMRCPKHGAAAHIQFMGKGPESFQPRIGGCCEEFCNSVNKKVIVEMKRGSGGYNIV